MFGWKTAETFQFMLQQQTVLLESESIARTLISGQQRALCQLHWCHPSSQNPPNVGYHVTNEAGGWRVAE